MKTKGQHPRLSSENVGLRKLGLARCIEYVKDHVHTNGMENFWSLLKRGLGGTYVSVEPFHLFRYIDEQSFRFNNRGSKENRVHDGERFQKVLAQVAGRRIMYSELTGKGMLPAAGTN